MPEIVWLIILALCLVVEIATLGLVTIWFAGGALVTFFAGIPKFSIASSSAFVPSISHL